MRESFNQQNENMRLLRWESFILNHCIFSSPKNYIKVKTRKYCGHRRKCELDTVVKRHEHVVEYFLSSSNYAVIYNGYKQ